MVRVDGAGEQLQAPVAIAMKRFEPGCVEGEGRFVERESVLSGVGEPVTVDVERTGRVDIEEGQPTCVVRGGCR